MNPLWQPPGHIPGVHIPGTLTPIAVAVQQQQAAAAQAQKPAYRPVSHLCHVCRSSQVANAYDMCPSCAQADAKRHSEKHRLELFTALLRNARSAANAAISRRLRPDFNLSSSTKSLFGKRQSIILSGWLLWDKSRFDADAGLMGIQRDDHLVLAENGNLYHLAGRKLYNPDRASAQAMLQAGLIAPGERYELERLEAYTAALTNFAAKLGQ